MRAVPISGALIELIVLYSINGRDVRLRPLSPHLPGLFSYLTQTYIVLFVIYFFRLLPQTTGLAYYSK